MTKRKNQITPKKLSDRQERLRRLLISNMGFLDYKKTAEDLGVDVTTLWVDRQAIRALGPPAEVKGRWDEEAAIDGSIEFFESGIGVLLADLQLIQRTETDFRAATEAAIQEEIHLVAKDKNHKPRHVVPFDLTGQAHNLRNQRLGVMNQIRTWRSDLNDFLLAIGYVRPANLRLDKGDDPTKHFATTDEALEEIENMRRTMNRIRRRRQTAAKKAKK